MLPTTSITTLALNGTHRNALVVFIPRLLVTPCLLILFVVIGCSKIKHLTHMSLATQVKVQKQPLLLFKLQSCHPSHMIGVTG